MITFTHNRANDEQATHNGGWDTSYISRGFYESSVKPRENYSFNRQSKTANFGGVGSGDSGNQSAGCPYMKAIIIVTVLLLLLGAVGYFVLGVGKNQVEGTSGDMVEGSDNGDNIQGDNGDIQGGNYNGTTSSSS